MKKSILILVSIFITTFSGYSQSSSKELGIRYLKLGNTYREAGDWPSAEKYIEKGLSLAGNDEYWKAVAYEYMGYTERDRAFSKTPVDTDALRAARNYLADAYDIYDRVITMRDGSPAALRQLELEKTKIDDYLSGKNSSNSSNSFGNTLNYDSQKLKDFPKDVSPDVVNLSMKDNKFSLFPYEATTLRSLNYLNLSENKIKDVPPAVQQMRSLKWLDLSGNKLKELPNEVAMLGSLEILDLSDNKIKEIPSAMCQMQGLKVLDISGNKIEFERIKTLIQCLPNTNIIHDKYEREDENGTGNLILGQNPALPQPNNGLQPAVPNETTPQERRP